MESQGQHQDEVSELDLNQTPTVFFDLETGGLRTGVDILQIGAVWEDNSFMQYITPTIDIDPRASNVNGLIRENGSLAKIITKDPYATEKLETLPIEEALLKFLSWLNTIGPCYLVGHNVKFDKRHLLYQMEQCCLTTQVNEHILGFIDTLPMFRSLYPDLGYGKYNQENLVKVLLNNDIENLEAHDALSDVLILQKLVNTSKANYNTLLRYVV